MKTRRSVAASCSHRTVAVLARRRRLRWRIDRGRNGVLVGRVPARPAARRPSAGRDADEPFGAACSAVPASGAGSFAGMAADPVATAASNNPVLSTLVTAVKEAGLVDTLNTAQDITVFAPTNDAFAQDPAGDPEQGAGRQATLIKRPHLPRRRPEGSRRSSWRGEHKTLQGGTVTISGSGEDFKVNGDAKVVCGNVQTANATVYIIDSVLMPPK